MSEARIQSCDKPFCIQLTATETEKGTTLFVYSIKVCSFCNFNLRYKTFPSHYCYVDRWELRFAKYWGENIIQSNAGVPKYTPFDNQHYEQHEAQNQQCFSKVL